MNKEFKRMMELAGLTEIKVNDPNKNKDLISFKQLIDKGDIKKAARLYYGTGKITGYDAREALSYVKSKGLEKQFDDLDPDFDPAGGSGIHSHI
jgi:hypothetical protein